MTERYCRNCGAELDAGSNYCSECGEPVGDDTRRIDPDDSRYSSSSGDQDDSRYGSSPGYGTAARTEETTFAALTHVLALFTWVIGPLVVLVVTEDPFVEENARNALNWQIVFTIYMIASLVLVIVLVGVVLMMVVAALDTIFCIVAAVKANDGEAWQYPLTPGIV